MDTFLFSYCIFLIQKEIWLKLVIVPITYSLSYKNKNGKTFLSFSLLFSLLCYKAYLLFTKVIFVQYGKLFHCTKYIFVFISYTTLFLFIESLYKFQHWICRILLLNQKYQLHLEQSNFKTILIRCFSKPLYSYTLNEW